MNWLFASDGQSIGPSASASVLPVNIQGGVPLGLASLISLLSKGLSGVSPTAQFQSISSSVLSLLYDPTLTFIHDYWENYSFDYTFVGKVIMLSWALLPNGRLGGGHRRVGEASSTPVLRSAQPIW